jgi:hypothetical protein
MKKYVTKQNVVALARIAILCALGFLIAGVSPAFAAMMSRSFDVNAPLNAVWSMMRPGWYRFFLRVSPGARHFWQVGHQNVERPFWVNRLTMPLQPAA